MPKPMTFEEWHSSLCCEDCDIRCQHKEHERLAWHAATAAERERCAMVAEAFREEPGTKVDTGRLHRNAAVAAIAAAIRAGGKEPKP